MADFTVLGSSGLETSGGRINEEWHRRLKSRTARFKLFREMYDQEPILNAITNAIVALAQQVSIDVQAAGKTPTPRQLQIRDYAASLLGDMDTTWGAVQSDVWQFMIYGFSPFERVFKLRKGETKDPRTSSKYSDGMIGVRRIAPRSPPTIDRWKFDEADPDTVAGAYQRVQGRPEVFLPASVLLNFRGDHSKNNPEGRSCYRSSVPSYHYAANLRESEAIGLRRNLAGMPVMQVPMHVATAETGPNAALYDDLKKAVQEISIDERMGLVIPAEEEGDQKTGFKFDLLASSGKSQLEADPVIKRYETRMAISMLADFIMMAIDKVGAFSTYKGKTNFFGMAFSGYFDRITEVLNRHLLDPLYAMQAIPVEDRAYYVHGDISTVDFADLASALSSLGNAGFIMSTRELEKELLKRMSLPQPEEALDKEEDRGDPSLQTVGAKNALLAVVEMVSSGAIPAESAIAVLTSAFSLAPDAAQAIVEPAAREALARAERPAPIEIGKPAPTPNSIPDGGSQP